MKFHSNYLNFNTDNILNLLVNVDVVENSQVSLKYCLWNEVSDGQVGRAGISVTWHVLS